MTYLHSTPSYISGGGSFGADHSAHADSTAPGLQTLLAQMWLWLQACGLVMLSGPEQVPAFTSEDLEALRLQEQAQKRFEALDQVLLARAPHVNLRARTLSMITAAYGFTSWQTAPLVVPSQAEMKIQVEAIVWARMKVLRLRYIKWHNSRVWLWKNTHALTCANVLEVVGLRALRHVRRSYAALIPD